MNEKGSIRLPENFVAFLKASVVVTQGFERNLLALSVDSFSDLARQISAMSQTDPLVRLLTRVLLGNAQEVKLAADGKIQLPEHLRQFADLEQEVVLAGLGEYFEIWSTTGWEIQLNRMQDVEANANRFSGQNLAIHKVA